MGDSLRVLKEFPAGVQDEVGYAVYLAQSGGRHVSAKLLKGLGSEVLEVVADHRGDTFPAVYYGAFGRTSVRAARLSEEVQAWDSDAADRDRSDSAALEACDRDQ